MIAAEEGPASPAFRQRQKRQRRITAGGKAADAALCPPLAPPVNNAAEAAAAPAAVSEAESDALEAAWGDYLCAGQPAVWAFLKPTLPEDVLRVMRWHHPAAVFPAYFPHSLPPGVPQLPALELPPATEAVPPAAAGPAPVPVLRPAGGPPLPLPAVAQAAPHQQQHQEQPAAIPRLVPAAPQPAASGHADGGAAEATSSGQAVSWSADVGYSSGGVSTQHCWCSECFPLGSYYTESPESTRMEPGKRISWRAALRSGDPAAS
ncbi:hypothetical protein ABPG75_012534 [Micractinium tetrahymenae]